MNNTQKINFISAIKSNNLDRIKNMIAENSTLLHDMLDQNNSSALHIATQYSTAEITTFLIHTYNKNYYACFLFFLPRPACFNIRNTLGETPLQLAITHNQAQNIEPLLHAGATLEPHFIHLAAFMGHLEVVQTLLRINSSLLNIFDDEGKTPLMAAIRSLSAHPVVECLLEAGADPYLASDCPEKPMHNKPPLLWAMEYKNDKAISIIIKKVHNTHEQSRLFDCIHSGEQALKLMQLNAENIKLMLKNTKIKQFTQAQDAYATDTSFGFYQLSSEQRSSFFADINPETGKINIFHPHVLLSKGTVTSIRSFINSKQESLVIKTSLNIHNRKSHLAIRHKIKSAKKEVNLLNLAYNTNRCRLFTFTNTATELRTVMPYVAGISMDKFIAETPCTTTIARCILQATEALISLHEKNIIHGDVKPKNILISTNPTSTATFINFGYAYQLTDEHATFFAFAQNTQNVEHFAPERFSLIPKPHTSQDVFSFGYMLLHYSIPQHEKRRELIQRYPCIPKFIERALSSQPHKRPTLASLHEQLSHAIDKEQAKQVITAAAIR